MTATPTQLLNNAFARSLFLFDALLSNSLLLFRYATYIFELGIPATRRQPVLNTLMVTCFQPLNETYRFPGMHFLLVKGCLFSFFLVWV